VHATKLKTCPKEKNPLAYKLRFKGMVIWVNPSALQLHYTRKKKKKKNNNNKNENGSSIKR
jgi:hypothetical protein